MLKRRLFLLVMTCGLSCGWATLASAEDAQSAVQFDAVLVTGEVPGPSLWKVTHGDHTMWVLGIIQPLPKKLQWRSKYLEEIIGHSQEVITAGRTNVDIDVGFMEGMKSIPNIMRMRRNPDDATLADVLDPDVYAKWSVLKTKYIGRSDSIERLRPYYAAQKLQEGALEKSGMSVETEVWPTVRKIAKRHRVKITLPDVDMKVKIDHASEMMKDLVTIPIDDRDCFRTTIEQLEDDLATKKARANAWAVGDLVALRELYGMPQTVNCMQVVRTALAAHEGSTAKYSAHDAMAKAQAENANGRLEVERRWLAAVEAALDHNQSTFAVLSMYDVVNQKGRLALLREKGYAVEAPSE
jgi:hypothetical protein